MNSREIIIIDGKFLIWYNKDDIENKIEEKFTFYIVMYLIYLIFILIIKVLSDYNLFGLMF